MKPANRMASLALLVFAATLIQPTPARADGISSYKVVDLGLPIYQTNTSSPTIDESGNLVLGSQRIRDTGVYNLGVANDPQQQGHSLYNYLYTSGNTINLLPQTIQDPSTSVVQGVNSSGLVIGYTSYQPFIYSAATGQYLPSPEWLPGQTQQPILAAINNAGQIVANENMPLFYSSPTAEPVKLTDLLPAPTGWKFLTVTDINDQGDIVGTGVNPSGQSVDFELVPTTVPEPTTLTLLCLAGLMYAGRRIRSRGPLTR